MGPTGPTLGLIALDDGAPVLTCTTTGGGLLYASRGDSSVFETEAIDVAPYASSLEGFQVSADGTAHLLLGRHAPGATVETALVLRSRPRGGAWSEKVLWEHDFNRAAFAFDSEGEPMWAAWAIAATDSVTRWDLWLGRSSEEPRAVAQGVERTGGPAFAHLPGATEPQLLAGIETPTLFVSPEGSETAAEVMLAPVAASYSTTCPTVTPSNCSGAVGTCSENGHRYGQLGLLPLEQGSAVAVYTHELIDRDYELLGCSGRVVATERGSVELAITRTPVAEGDAEPEVLLSRPFDSMGFNLGDDQDLKVAATGNVIHVFDGIDYLVVDAGAL